MISGWNEKGCVRLFRWVASSDPVRDADEFGRIILPQLLKKQEFVWLVVVQFKNTPKAFANFSPGLELATTLGAEDNMRHNPEKGSPTFKPCQGSERLECVVPGFSFLEPWADISERLRRIFN